MKLPYFSKKMVERLHEQAAVNAPKYGANATWLETFAVGQQYIFECGRVVDPPPSLVFGEDNNPKNDAENARRIYNWLPTLSPSVAMEERLWGHLAHCVFPEYMAARWPVTAENIIHRRYLFEDKTFASLARNGISRLWWAGKLTHDETRLNPFELTDVLFMRQDIQVSLLERAIGKCHNVRTAVLDFFRENSGWLAEEAFGYRIQQVLKELNLLGGVAVLDALSKPQLQAFLKKVGESLAGNETSADTVAS
jgi:hypothetical protein